MSNGTAEPVQGRRKGQQVLEAADKWWINDGMNCRLDLGPKGKMNTKQLWIEKNAFDVRRANAEYFDAKKKEKNHCI